MRGRARPDDHCHDADCYRHNPPPNRPARRRAARKLGRQIAVAAKRGGKGGPIDYARSPTRYLRLPFGWRLVREAGGSG